MLLLHLIELMHWREVLLMWVDAVALVGELMHWREVSLMLV
jgi:hypothetical protein